MANESPPDPAAMFRELVTQWERNFNALANQIMGTESFNRVMQEAQKVQLGVQQTTADVMARRLAALNMPTREDVIRVAEKLHEVERRLARIEGLLAGGAAVANTDTSARPRTRRPPPDYLGAEGKP